jgi:hypothetical protein
MKNLKVYSGDAFLFHKKVCDSKNTTNNDPLYKSRLEALNPDIEDAYEDYDHKSSGDDLASLTDSIFTDTQKTDLHKLYSYASVPVKELKEEVTTILNNRTHSTCQNCTILSIGSMDHYVPQEDFPEFIVNPHNLVPSCKDCNGYKNKVWRENGDCTFINLYSDILPQVDYLFVDINYEDDVFIPTFLLNNSNGIDARFFAKVENHYNKLHLPRRFREESNRIITDLTIGIESRETNISLTSAISTSLRTANAFKVCYGHNYWIAVLQIALLNNQDFIQSLR